MKSVMKGINKKDAKLLLRALDNHSITYYKYKDGRDWDGGELNPQEPLENNDLDRLFDLTQSLAEKIGLDMEVD